MKLLHLTAGTGRWYCGTCVRDDTLVKALRARGDDADLVPLYLPVVADGVSCSAGQPVLMSGVNVYLQQASALFRAMPRWMDAPLGSRAMLSLAGRFAGSTRAESLGDLTVSMLRGEDGFQRKELARLTDALQARPRPDVVLLSNSLLAGLAPLLRRTLGVPVLVTVQGEMHFLDGLDTGRDEAWALLAHQLAAADGRIAVSEFAASSMAARTGLARDRFDVVPNGVPVDGIERPLPDGDVPVLGFLARLSNVKGLDRVARIFVRLREQGVALRLAVAGTAMPGEASALDAFWSIVRAAGLEADVEVHPNVDLAQKRTFLRKLTVFCVPTAKDETSATYNLEAMAAGIPVVAPRRGAVPEAIEAIGGGVLVPPDDEDAAVAAIAALLGDPGRRRVLGDAGWAGVRASRTDAHMAAGAARVVARVTGPAAR